MWNDPLRCIVCFSLQRRLTRLLGYSVKRRDIALRRGIEQHARYCWRLRPRDITRKLPFAPKKDSAPSQTQIDSGPIKTKQNHDRHSQPGSQR